MSSHGILVVGIHFLVLPIGILCQILPIRFHFGRLSLPLVRNQRGCRPFKERKSITSKNMPESTVLLYSQSSDAVIPGYCGRSSRDLALR